MSKKLSIALICDPIGPNKSGVVVSTIRFGKLLEERGHHVIFVGAKSAEYTESGLFENIFTYRYRSVAIPQSGGWYTAFPTFRELHSVFLEEGIDVVHITLPMTGAIVAIKVAQKIDIPVIAHSHSQPENLFMNLPKLVQPLLSKIWNKYLVWVYKKATTIIYPSELARDLLHDLSAESQPFAVISNGINLKEFKPDEGGNFIEKFQIPKDSLKILYLGRLFPEKSIDTLIKAVPLIRTGNPNIHIMIAGAGHSQSKLEKLVKKFDVSKEVTFLGLVSNEDRLRALNVSDIFVLPSVAELEGMVILEAMAVGKPIVVSDAKMSASRYFVDGNGFLFTAGDHEDLAKQVLKLSADPELRMRMGKVSFEKAKEYDIEKSVDLLEEVYNSVIKK